MINEWLSVPVYLINSRSRSTEVEKLSVITGGHRIVRVINAR